MLCFLGRLLSRTCLPLLLLQASVLVAFLLSPDAAVCIGVFQRLGSPLLRITRDILVGPTSSQERLLAARVVQEVIARYAQPGAPPEFARCAYGLSLFRKREVKRPRAGTQLLVRAASARVSSQGLSCDPMVFPVQVRLGGLSGNGGGSHGGTGGTQRRSRGAPYAAQGRAGCPHGHLDGQGMRKLSSSPPTLSILLFSARHWWPVMAVRKKESVDKGELLRGVAC